MTTLHNELTKLFNENATGIRKYKYFMWKNKIKGLRIDYSSMTEQELTENMKLETLHFYNKWENSQEYLFLKLLLTRENMQSDLFNIYDAVKEKALEGDDKSIKTFLELEREVNKRLESITKIGQIEEVEIEEVEDDDNLRLNIDDIKGLVD